MNKGLLIGALALLFSFTLSAQEAHVHGPWCAADKEHQKLKDKYPSIEETERAYMKQLAEIIRNTPREEGEVLRIPTVVHVLHERGPENISDAQVYRAIQLMNEHFRKIAPDTTEVIPEFKDIHADVGVEFVLANKTPNGECTNGINRIATAFTDDDRSGRTKFEGWPRHVYMNVWVVRNIGADPTGVGTTLGYATLPPGVDEPFLAFFDGIVILSTAMGDIGTANLNYTTTLTHEAGHFLNLIHTWGPGVVATACGNDGLADTPETPGRFGCPTPAQATICNEGVVENYQNYMDYSSCTFMFTEDQASLMRATLASPVAGRSFLVTDAAHQLAGIDSDDPEICAPQTDFFANRYSSCIGSNIRFTPNIGRATADTYQWSFPGGEPSSSEEESPVVTYAEAGWKTVTLTAANESGSDTKTEEFAVYIQPAENLSGEDIGGQFLIKESFWDFTHIGDGFTIAPANENSLVSGVNWAHSPVGCLDQGSIKLNLFDTPTPERYSFMTPRYDLSDMPEGSTMSFKYAYATQANLGLTDVQFRVYITANCGASRSLRFSRTNQTELVTGGNFGGIPFEPDGDPSLWKTVVIPINEFSVDGIQFEFEVIGDFGANNFFIDNITIGTSTVSTDDESPLGEVNLFPNPAKDFAQLDLNLNAPSEVGVRIFDITGKQVQQIQSQMLPGGKNTLRINTGSLGAGMYTVKVLGNGIDRALKLVVQP